MSNNLKSLREMRHWTHDQAAAAMGVSRGQFIKLERGERRLTVDYVRQAARAFGVEEKAVFADDGAEVPIAGYVGAGAIRILYAEGQGTGEMVPAPPDATPDTVALIIRGTSLGENFEGWLLFYNDVHSPVTPDMIGALCVVGLADGRILVKSLRRGLRRGTYTLHSNEPPMYDQEVLWAARVTHMRPQ